MSSVFLAFQGVFFGVGVFVSFRLCIKLFRQSQQQQKQQQVGRRRQQLWQYEKAAAMGGVGECGWMSGRVFSRG